MFIFITCNKIKQHSLTARTRDIILITSNTTACIPYSKSCTLQQCNQEGGGGGSGGGGAEHCTAVEHIGRHIYNLTPNLTIEYNHLVDCAAPHLKGGILDFMADMVALRLC